MLEKKITSDVDASVDGMVLRVDMLADYPYHVAVCLLTLSGEVSVD